MVLGRDNGTNIGFFVILLGQCSINCVEGQGELFHFAVMIIRIVDNSAERRCGDGTYFIILWRCNPFNGCRGR
jgi:hypothetical protein